MGAFEQFGLHHTRDSRRGPRETNEDCAGVDPEIGLAMIADGMGGGDCGDKASQYVINLAPVVWREAMATLSGRDLMEKVIRRVNTNLYEKGTQERLDLGTTLTLLHFCGKRIWLGHVGDTRAYRIREGAIELLTEDQRAGGTVLSANIGSRKAVDPSICELDWRPGDTFVLATDGLWALLNAGQLAALALESSPSELAGALMAGRENYAQDNYTVLVCWDDQTVMDWRKRNTDALRGRFHSSPTDAVLDELLNEEEKSGHPSTVYEELARALGQSDDASLIALARARLSALELRRFLMLPQLAGNTDAAGVLVDSIVEADEVDQTSIETVARAAAENPTPTRMLYLWRHLPDSTHRTECAQYLLSQDPDPWFEVWTGLLESAFSGPQGRAHLEGVCAGLQKGQLLPGAAMLGLKGETHPVDRALSVWLDKHLGLIRKEADLARAETVGRLTGLETECNSLRKRQTEQEKRLDSLAEGLTEMQVLPERLDSHEKKWQGLELELGQVGHNIGKRINVVSAAVSELHGELSRAGEPGKRAHYDVQKLREQLNELDRRLSEFAGAEGGLADGKRNASGGPRNHCGESPPRSPGRQSGSWAYLTSFLSLAVMVGIVIVLVIFLLLLFRDHPDWFRPSSHKDYGQGQSGHVSSGIPVNESPVVRRGHCAKLSDVNELVTESERPRQDGVLLCLVKETDSP